MELKEVFKKLFKWMKVQTLKKQDFVDFQRGRKQMKGLKMGIRIVIFTNKSLLTLLSCKGASFKVACIQKRLVENVYCLS